MPTRRQEKTARVIKEAVSDAIINHLGDPRITAFVSVTRVEVAADMRMADVYLSMFGGDQTAQDLTFNAIVHARPKIQMVLGEHVKSKFCPVLRLHKDDRFKKAIETMNLIDRAVKKPQDTENEEQ